MSNGSVVKDNTDGNFVNDTHQAHEKQSISSDKEIGIKNSDKDDTSNDLKDKNNEGIVEGIAKINLSGEEEKEDENKSDSEISSTSSSSSDESEDEESDKEQEKQKQVNESMNHDGNGSGNDATDNSEDKNKVAGLSSEELALKLQEAWSKCEELKEKRDEQEQQLAAADEKNKVSLQIN